MVTDWYNTAMHEIATGALRLGTDVLGLMLVNDDYEFDADHDVVDNGANDVTDPSFCELSATNYSRKVLTGQLGIVLDKAEGEVRVSIPDQLFVELGGASDDDIAAAILFAGSGADTAKRLVAHVNLRVDSNPVTTTGQDTVIDFRDDASGGTLRVFRTGA